VNATQNRLRIAASLAGPTAFEHEQRPLTCKKGHSLAGDNVGVKPSTGRRYCRRCEIERGNRRRTAIEQEQVSA
jgi:hypothetical protein